MLAQAQPRNVFKKRYWLYALVFVFAAVFYASFVFRENVLDFIFSFADYLGVHKYLGVLIFVAISALSAIISPLSSIPLTPFAIVAWGYELTLFFLLLGWIIGGATGWIIGYYAGERVVRRHYSFKKIEYYKNKLSTETQFWLVLIFRFAIPSEITGFTLGILKYSFGKYLLATFITEFPFALLAVYSSEALVGGQVFVFTGLIALALIFIGIMSLYFKKRIKK